MDTQPMEILLVEDNEDDILLEQEALADAKLVNLMCVVRDGEEAMAYLRRQGKYQNVADARPHSSRHQYAEEERF